jgi:two-component system, NtrC family, nitrogen regulation sensor histidine kinase NtrY
MADLFKSRPVQFLIIAAFLAAMIPASLVVKEWQTSRVEEAVLQRQDERATAALEHVDREFRLIEKALHDRARDLAENRLVISALRERDRTGGIDAPSDLIRFVASLPLAERSGLEIHDLSPRVIAWGGVTVPMDAAPSSDRFLAAYQSSIVEDSDRRVALVAWWPVRDGARVLGAVRLVQVVRTTVPVQNQFISDYDVASAWQRQVRLPVRIEYGDSGPPRDAGRMRTRVLQGVDGTVLGRIHVEPPSLDAIVADTSARYDHVVAFWATLLLIWLTIGIWRSTFVDGPGSDSSSTRGATRGATRAIAAVGWLVAVRYAMVWLDVPARWQRGKAPLAPIFDPAHLASSYAAGIFRSTGDLVLTALFSVLIALVIARFVLRSRSFTTSELRREPTPGWLRSRYVGYCVLALTVCVSLVAGLRVVSHHAVLDSTLSYFSRATLIPASLEIVVLAALILMASAAVIASVAVFWPAMRLLILARHHRKEVIPRTNVAVGILVLLTVGIGLAYSVAFGTSLAFLIVSGMVGSGLWSRDQQVDLLYLRSILPILFILTLIIYPLLFEGMNMQRRMQMRDAADTFAEGRDPRVMFALEQAMQDASLGTSVSRLMQMEPSPQNRTALDSLASRIVRTSLLGSLGGYEVSVTFVDDDGSPRGRHVESDVSGPRTVHDELDAVEFDILRQMYRESGAQGSMVEQVTGRRDPGRLQYEGIRPMSPAGIDPSAGWVMARAEPRSILHDYTAPFPRVLLPASTYESMYAGLSIAEFRDGVLVRNVGREFGRYRLDDEIWADLRAQRETWRRDRADGQIHLTYYERQDAPRTSGLARETVAVTAIRVPAVNMFDHLFFLLRVTVAGLALAIPLYFAGIIFRWEVGWLPAPRVRFRDKVLNAFLAVGILAVVVVGFIGLRLVTGENERAIQNWLRQHLDRVEETLALDAGPDEMPYRVLERTNVDSLAARVGLDLNIYQGPWLIASSRPQLMRERLLEDRLPIAAFKALFHDGYRFASTQERVGTFEYTAGFQALPDEQGRPRFVISVPTLPEQERIEEERARTVAYLFGALLLLILVVMVTASLLADALARPVARLREGLESVAHGRFHRPLPVDSRDEIGELVGTFNEMQRQLVESRRKLAQQERQLAWREMARQVAHEIKNPLTPMKLSVQHLRRAHDALETSGDGALRPAKFDSLFQRITTTLIEQIDALARIANEFHSFARLPSRVLESLDLNEVVLEAIALMQEEANSEMDYESSHQSLIVQADREELRRIFINLLKNALQAIPPERRGSIMVRTRVERTDDGLYWAVADVVDNGVGIAAELHDRIFEPNFSTKTSGTGLGLAITRKSVEDMQGEIVFETDVEVGTTFTVRLPLSQSERAA